MRRVKAVFANYTDADGVPQHASQNEQIEVSGDEETRLDDAGALYSDEENEAYEEEHGEGVPAHPDQIDEQAVKEQAAVEEERAEITAEAHAEADEKAAEEIAKAEEERAAKAEKDAEAKDKAAPKSRSRPAPKADEE